MTWEFYAACATWAVVQTAILWFALGPKKPPRLPPIATWADSVAVGFPVDRADGLIAHHVGGSYTYLSKNEAVKLADDLLRNAQRQG